MKSGQKEKQENSRAPRRGAVVRQAGVGEKWRVEGGADAATSVAVATAAVAAAATAYWKNSFTYKSW